MALPTKTQISDAIECMSNVLDPKLVGFKTVDGIFGAEMYCGGFCMVYPLEDNAGRKYAFRVWHQEIDGIKERIKKIAAYLKSINNPYFVEFEYVENALNVPDASGDQQIDAIRMDWVSGQNLIGYIDSIINSTDTPNQKKQALLELAEKFKEMVISLHESHISHGDLQHGNIMIAANKQLKLVDYDSVCVPTFTNEVQVTSGLIGYQHPCRKNLNAVASEKDDYFSEYIIYAALLAYAEDMTLWEAIDNEDNPRDEYSLLFKESDLLNPSQSQLFSRLRSYGNSTLNELLDVLIEVLNQPDCSQLQPLETLTPSNKYIEQPSAVVLDDDFLSELGAPRSQRRTYKKQTIQPAFDEDEARKRYAQN